MRLRTAEAQAPKGAVTGSKELSLTIAEYRVTQGQVVQSLAHKVSFKLEALASDVGSKEIRNKIAPGEKWQGLRLRGEIDRGQLGQQAHMWVRVIVDIEEKVV